MSTSVRLAVYFLAAAIGVTLPLLNLPSSLLAPPALVLLGVAMAVSYRAAWRQGHSGVFILPLIRGPLGTSGLSLRLSHSERIVITAIAAFFLGLVSSIAWVVLRS